MYVAATRARDHLIISGAVGRGRVTGDHWLGRIAASLDLDDEERPESLAYPGGEVMIGWHDSEEIIKVARDLPVDEDFDDTTGSDASIDRIDSHARPGSSSPEAGAFPLVRDLARSRPIPDSNP